MMKKQLTALALTLCLLVLCCACGKDKQPATDGITPPNNTQNTTPPDDTQNTTPPAGTADDNKTEDDPTPPAQDDPTPPEEAPDFEIVMNENQLKALQAYYWVIKNEAKIYRRYFTDDFSSPVYLDGNEYNTIESIAFVDADGDGIVNLLVKSTQRYNNKTSIYNRILSYDSTHNAVVYNEYLHSDLVDITINGVHREKVDNDITEVRVVQRTEDGNYNSTMTIASEKYTFIWNPIKYYIHADLVDGKYTAIEKKEVTKEEYDAFVQQAFSQPAVKWYGYTDGSINDRLLSLGVQDTHAPVYIDARYPNFYESWNTQTSYDILKNGGAFIGITGSGYITLADMLDSFSESVGEPVTLQRFAIEQLDNIAAKEIILELSHSDEIGYVGLTSDGSFHASCIPVSDLDPIANSIKWYDYSIEVIDALYTSPLSADAEVDDLVTFGSFEQDNDFENGSEKIVWRVLAKQDGKMLLISQNVLECRPVYTGDGTYTWETCSLREYLNGEFFDKVFDDSEKLHVVTANNYAAPNGLYGTPGGNDTVDKVFLLSGSELAVYMYDVMSVLYTGYDKHQFDACCVPTAYARSTGVSKTVSAYRDNPYYCSWWLRTPGYDSSRVSHVGNRGELSGYGVNMTVGSGNGVRPAVWVTLDESYDTEQVYEPPYIIGSDQISNRYATGLVIDLENWCNHQPFYSFDFEDASELTSETLLRAFSVLNPNTEQKDAKADYRVTQADVTAVLDRYFKGHRFDITECSTYDPADGTATVRYDPRGYKDLGIDLKGKNVQLKHNTLTFTAYLTDGWAKEYEIEFYKGGYYFIKATEIESPADNGKLNTDALRAYYDFLTNGAEAYDPEENRERTFADLTEHPVSDESLKADISNIRFAFTDFGADGVLDLVIEDGYRGFKYVLVVFFENGRLYLDRMDYSKVGTLKTNHYGEELHTGGSTAYVMRSFSSEKGEEVTYIAAISDQITQIYYYSYSERANGTYIPENQKGLAKGNFDELMKGYFKTPDAVWYSLAPDGVIADISPLFDAAK